MHEYPLVFYFLVFALSIWFLQDLSIALVALVFYVSGLYAHKLFEVLRLKRLEFEYPHVFILPFPFKGAFTFGNSILVSKGLLEEDKDILKAILYHELGHIRFRDFTTVFLLILVYYLLVEKVRSVALLFAYLLLFVWIYWHMEARSDLYAKARGSQIEKALERFSLSWRLAFIRGQEGASLQRELVFWLLVFFVGFYAGRELFSP